MRFHEILNEKIARPEVAAYSKKLDMIIRHIKADERFPRHSATGSAIDDRWYRHHDVHDVEEIDDHLERLQKFQLKKNLIRQLGPVKASKVNIDKLFSILKRKQHKRLLKHRHSKSRHN